MDIERGYTLSCFILIQENGCQVRFLEKKRLLIDVSKSRGIWLAFTQGQLISCLKYVLKLILTPLLF